jgi:hypothetical protein
MIAEIPRRTSAASRSRLDAVGSASTGSGDPGKARNAAGLAAAAWQGVKERPVAWESAAAASGVTFQPGPQQVVGKAEHAAAGVVNQG